MAPTASDQMLDIPRIIHRIWLGPDPMPTEFVAYGATWNAHHPEWEMRLWTDQNRPRLTNEQLFLLEPTYAGRSDLLRFEVLWMHGGLYIDTDFECLRPIEPLLEGKRCVLGWESNLHIATGLIASLPRHPLLSAIIAELSTSTSLEQQSVSDRSGPLFLARLLDSRPDLRMTFDTYGQDVFYPPKGDLQARQTAYAVHYGAASWIKADQPI